MVSSWPVRHPAGHRHHENHLFSRKAVCHPAPEARSAPLFVDGTGLNDDLNGVERPVTFDIRDSG